MATRYSDRPAYSRADMPVEDEDFFAPPVPEEPAPARTGSAGSLDDWYDRNYGVAATAGVGGKTREQWVGDLYRKYLGRDPDPEGLALWVNSGMNPAELETSISKSPEAQRYGVPNQGGAPGGGAGGGGGGRGGTISADDWAWATQGLTANEKDQGTLNTVADRLRSRGYDVKLPETDEYGRNQGLIINGQIHRVIDSSNNWTLKAGSEAWGGEPSSGGGAATGSYIAPFTEPFQYDPFAAPEGFVGPTWTAPTDVTEQNDPGFQARLKAGEEALQRSAAAKGTLLTGGTLKDLNQWGQEYAANEYQNVYNRQYNDYKTKYGTAWDEYKTNYQNKFNEWNAGYEKAKGEYNTRYGIFENNQSKAYDRMMGVLGLGLQGAQGYAQAGTGYASNYGNYLGQYGANQSDLITGAGNATAAGQAAGSQAWGNAFGGIANNAGTLGSIYAMNRWPGYGQFYK